MHQDVLLVQLHLIHSGNDVVAQGVNLLPLGMAFAGFLSAHIYSQSMQEVGVSKASRGDFCSGVTC